MLGTILLIIGWRSKLVEPHTFPGHGAARSGAPLIRDRSKLGASDDPGSAAHHHSARKTRVNAQVALRCAREMSPLST
jgi:hypothetical protein